jgi:hypothetical protein
MAIRNQSWYNLNSTRDYPLADTASAISDDTTSRLPQDIITDLRIRWPDILGKYAFLGSVAATSGAVTAIILAATDLSNSDASYTPIAAISVPLKDFKEGKQYALDPMYPAVFGYIVFGSGTEAAWSGNFSSPAQSLLASRSARFYASLPVSSLGRLHDAAPLTGVVKLDAAPPLEVVKAEREIGGIWREVVVVRLKEDSSLPAAGALSPFEEFAGKCGKRPESENCGDPIPMETINAVGPDCDGIITLDFKGCAVVGKNTDDCGIVVDCGIGLSETCDPPRIPTLAGLLPSEELAEPLPAPPDPEPSPDPEESFSDVITSITLPYCDSFDDEVANNFSIQSGDWIFVYDNSPTDLCNSGLGYSYASEGATSGGARNVTLFTADAQTVYRTYKTDVKLRPGVAGMKHNAGIVLNHKTTLSGASTFYLLEIDWDDGVFRLVYFNGFIYNTLVTYDVPTLSLDEWYYLELTVVPASSLTTLDFTCKLESSTLNITLTHMISTAVYGTDSELTGFHANRSFSRFSYYRISEQT